MDVGDRRSDTFGGTRGERLVPGPGRLGLRERRTTERGADRVRRRARDRAGRASLAARSRRQPSRAGPTGAVATQFDLALALGASGRDTLAISEYERGIQMAAKKPPRRKRSLIEIAS